MFSLAYMLRSTSVLHYPTFAATTPCPARKRPETTTGRAGASVAGTPAGRAVSGTGRARVPPTSSRARAPPCCRSRGDGVQGAHRSATAPAPSTDRTLFCSIGPLFIANCKGCALLVVDGLIDGFRVENPPLEQFNILKNETCHEHKCLSRFFSQALQDQKNVLQKMSYLQ